MTVPSKAPVHVEAALVGKASNNVLDGTSQDVTIVGQTSGKGGAVVEGVPGLGGELAHLKQHFY